MIAAQKKAARLLAQRETAKIKFQSYHTTGAENRQAYIYAPAPGEIAYVAYDESWYKKGYVIVVSPCRFSSRGLWYADALPGRWNTEEEAQRALDDLADHEGWRLIDTLDQWSFDDDEY